MVYVFWDPKLLDRSRNKNWKFGPQVVDDILNKIYMIECPQTILDILSTFLNDRYCFRGLQPLSRAVNMWCQDLSRARALKKYGHISLWDVKLVTNMKRLFCGKTKFKMEIEY